jgi:hypothetical protein
VTKTISSPMGKSLLAKPTAERPLWGLFKAFFAFRRSRILLPSRAEALRRMTHKRDLFNGKPISDFRFGGTQPSADPQSIRRPSTVPRIASRR